MRGSRQRVVLITGATAGLGQRVAQELAADGAILLLHGRDPVKGRAVCARLRSATGNRQIHYYNYDLASLGEVRCFASDLVSQRSRIDVLINNAGIGGGPFPKTRQTSRDGYELRLAVNYLAPYLLTSLLLPLLRHAASARGTSRIVNIASGAQHSLDFDNPMLEREYDGKRAYSQSKLALVMYTFDLARHLAGSGVTANALHPASFMDTKMVRDWPLPSRTRVEEGAMAVVYLATASVLARVTGQYFHGLQPTAAAAQAYDEGARQRLRQLSEQWVGLVRRS